MRTTAEITRGAIGVYPIGALSIAFHEILGAESIIGRKNSKTTEWVMRDGVLRIDGAPRDVRAKLRRGFSGPGLPLPELVVVSPWADQLPDFLGELLELFADVDAGGAYDFALLPKFLLASSGIYFEDLREEARRHIERSALKRKEFFLEALERRLFRAVAYQAALRRGRGPAADYFCVRGAAYVVLSLNGKPEDRERVCELLRGRGYDITVESGFLQSEYDKAIVNATISAFSQAYASHEGRLLALRCGDILPGHPGLPAGFKPRLAPEAVSARLSAVGEAFVAVAKAKGVYSPEVSFKEKFERGVGSFVLKVAGHPPSSVQLLLDRLRDAEWTGESLLPTEEHVIGPMLGWASELGDQKSAAVFRELKRMILASYREILLLKEDNEPLLQRLAKGEPLDALESAVLRARTREDVRLAYGAAFGLDESEAEPFADNLRDAYARAAAALPEVSPSALWSRYLPLALHLAQKKAAGRAVAVGVHGLPGAGKTTLARILVALLKALRPDAGVVGLSIDDFYFDNAEREKRGLGWAVGAHDLSKAPLLDALKGAGAGDAIAVPRFDKKVRDMRREPELVKGPVDFIVFEGFGVGLRSGGYDALSSRLDYSIALRAPEAACKAWRSQAGWADRKTAHNDDRSSFDKEFEALWAGVRGQFAPVCSEVERLCDLYLDLAEGHRIEAFRRRA